MPTSCRLQSERCCRLAVLAVCCFLCGCRQSQPTAEETGSEVTTTANNANASTSEDVTIIADKLSDEVAQKKMLAAKDALFNKLSGRLMEAMGTVGPVQAIAVCKNEAPKIAEEIATEHGLKIGRIGVRLRNPRNAGPSWAKQLVAEKVAEPKFVQLSSGAAAALLPIKLQPQCLMCHGPEESLSADIKTQLSKLYPDDQATGFREGELRGWFWIEAPAT